MNDPRVYLIPSVIDENGYDALPAYILAAVKKCGVFFVENERTARRFLKKLWPEMVIDEYEWYVIHKAEESVKQRFLELIQQGKIVGILSEAGCPGIADPGQLLVEVAQRAGVLVKPLVGPNSIILALMASGMNGQHFRFNGYLPIEDAQQAKTLKSLEAESHKTGCSQVFIETPYRNNRLLDAIVKNCSGNSRLCIAMNITAREESIITRPVSEWKKNRPEINKQPAVFILSAK
ncbi:MAG: SAM-dependent methyltransferase [Chitinophagaceae bacterium]|nr:SAM-dependent methyltransferase [Chitinophagaceae bacterium]MCW5925597.1 SAM-dependent methyltransferase [Chitinophagaceae bacterium]